MPHLCFFARYNAPPGCMHHVGIGHLVGAEHCLTQASRRHGVYLMSMSRCPVPDRVLSVSWVTDEWATRWCVHRCGLPLPWWRRWQRGAVLNLDRCCYAVQTPGELVAQFLVSAADAFSVPADWAPVVAALNLKECETITPEELGVITRKL